MKHIERFGGWVIANSVFTLPLAMIFTFIVVYTSLPDLVTLDGKNWRCNGAVPHGISSRCIGYEFIGK